MLHHQKSTPEILEFDGHLTHYILSFWGYTNTTALRLYLSHKSIESLAYNSFKNFFRLTSLNLSFNKIAVFNWEALSNQSSSLQYLNLSHNLISKIDHTNFSNMYQLKELNLSFNQIGEIADYTFLDLGLLKRLNLSHNKLKIITSFTFSGLNEMLNVFLECNEIDFISADAFIRQRSIIEDLMNVKKQKDFVRIGYNLSNVVTFETIFKGNPIMKRNLRMKENLIHFNL